MVVPIGFDRDAPCKAILVADGMRDLRQSIAMPAVAENRRGSLGNRESFEKKLRLGP
jgi:hypothetical protein